MTIWILGDSTAAAYGPDRAPLCGWGQVLAERLACPVENRAIAGRSTKTFLAEGRLTAAAEAMQPGDLALIQFGHNDAGDKPERHTEASGDFTDNLRIFVEAVRERAAQPVLLTPTPCRCWRDGALHPGLDGYPEAVRHAAHQLAVPLVDVHAQGADLLRRLGEDGSRALYMHLQPGAYAAYPQGLTDDTHTRRAGAEAFAKIILQALLAAGLIGEIHLRKRSEHA